MIYEYRCGKCRDAFDVIKSVAEMEREERCPHCQVPAVRAFAPRAVYFNGAKVEHPEYNPGLGCIVRNSSHRKEIAKQRGLEEVGSEPVENIHKKFEQDRAERVERAWTEADRGWVGNGDVGT